MNGEISGGDDRPPMTTFGQQVVERLIEQKAFDRYFLPMHLQKLRQIDDIDTMLEFLNEVGYSEVVLVAADPTAVVRQLLKGEPVVFEIESPPPPPPPPPPGFIDRLASLVCDLPLALINCISRFEGR